MSLRLYTTLGRQLVDFQPINDRAVGLYTCGPTVYSSAHIGNLRTYIFEDILRRTLEFAGYRVKHVMNITDVGHLTGDGDMGADKMEESAKREKKNAYDIAAAYTAEFFDDLKKLNIEPPTVILKATATIELQIKLIEQLETNGYTYRTSDGVYFETAKLPTYGQLSGQKTSEKQAGARVEVNDEKRQPSDFALWKFSKPEDHRQMEWPSPWGVGWPGWHIECSAMSLSEFPNGLDIHCGGVDHITVHHENELAQNEAAGHDHFVKMWMHDEFLVLPGKRMGKSEGNAVTLSELSVNPLFYRYVCLLTHYRKPLSFTTESLGAASTALTRIWIMLEDTTLDRSIKPSTDYIDRFTKAINDDLNTSAALGVVHDLINDDAVGLNVKISTLSVFDTVLALDLTPEAASKQLTPTGPGLESMLAEYEVARKEKRFVDSDTIRERFAKMKIVVEDTPSGSRLRKK